METKKEYIRYASQAVAKAAEAGFKLKNEDFLPCRIYPKNERDYGYIAFVAEVEKDGVPSYLYVKAYAGKTPRVAITLPKSEAEVKKFGIGHDWKAVGKTVWSYKKLENGDYEIISEDELKERRRQAMLNQ